MTANKTAEDRGEFVSKMEPLMPSATSRFRPKLHDLTLTLTAKSTALRASLPTGIAHALADLVRAMNCYYSNLIEGHNTHPVDIERALQEDYSPDPKKRDLQLEAKAHITVQQWIDEGGLTGRATSSTGILETHQRFCQQLPDELLWITHPDTGAQEQLIPGTLRQRDVIVGRHIAISPGALPRFMERFQKAYQQTGRVEAIIAAACAHHRLLWMHPFIDGNGRVARLMSYAMLRDALDTGGIWSIARGLARNDAEYKRLLARCDLPRRNDMDGRGNLSEEALIQFAVFFLETCIDQVDFMATLINPNTLRERILHWTTAEIQAGHLPQKSDVVLELILYRGELTRNEVAGILNTGERNARRLTSTLLKHGILTSKSPRSPLLLYFPAALAGKWMPGLFPDQRTM